MDRGLHDGNTPRLTSSDTVGLTSRR
eukprot:COSAG01_NODE_70704_length_258_cov_0.540881_1_plen_25_part_01